jgi:hypothetical protein
MKTKAELVGVLAKCRPGDSIAFQVIRPRERRTRPVNLEIWSRAVPFAFIVALRRMADGMVYDDDYRLMEEHSPTSVAGAASYNNDLPTTPT